MANPRERFFQPFFSTLLKNRRAAFQAEFQVTIAVIQRPQAKRRSDNKSNLMALCADNPLIERISGSRPQANPHRGRRRRALSFERSNYCWRSLYFQHAGWHEVVEYRDVVVDHLPMGHGTILRYRKRMPSGRF
jgi:hypothetical protein